jgi:hypothetical protein
MSYIYCALWLFSPNIYQENEKREILKPFAQIFEYNAITGQPFCELYSLANDVAVPRILSVFVDVFKGKVIHDMNLIEFAENLPAARNAFSCPFRMVQSRSSAGKCNIVNITEYVYALHHKPCQVLLNSRDPRGARQCSSVSILIFREPIASLSFPHNQMSIVRYDFRLSPCFIVFGLMFAREIA